MVGVSFEDAIGNNDGAVKGTRYFITGKDRGAFVDPKMVSLTASYGEYREATQSWNLEKDYSALIPSGELVKYTKGESSHSLPAVNVVKTWSLYWPPV